MIANDRLPPPDSKPRPELNFLVPAGFNGLKKDPPNTDSPPDVGDLPGSPTIDPNSIEPSR